MQVIKLKIKGMTCPSCSASVERLIDELEGIADRTINHVSDSGVIEFDDKLISSGAIIAKINEGHYKVLGEEVSEQAEPQVLACPECGNAGRLVPNTVFKALVKKDNYARMNLSREHYICMSPSCTVAYYNSDLKLMVDELKREIWFKEGSQREIICYCNNIDKEQIRDAIVHYKLSSWEGITGHYRNKVVEKCERFNPTGYCCRNTFNKVVSKLQKE